jgi:uncharacterized protein
MQKVIIDTNVIVSSLISKGIPSQIIYELVLNGKVKFCISDEIFDEYVDVLNREKFSRFPDFKANANIVISMIDELAIHENPDQKVDLLKDSDDNKFLELAIEVKADFIITGNTRDFTIKEIGITKIVTPAEYWDNFKPED